MLCHVPREGRYRSVRNSWYFTLQFDPILNYGKRLQKIKALDDDNNLTTFGGYLSRVPMDHRNATMYLYLWDCLHPVLLFIAKWKRTLMSHHELYQQYSQKFSVASTIFLHKLCQELIWWWWITWFWILLHIHCIILMITICGGTYWTSTRISGGILTRCR